ncbi:protein-L-isoaspartate(D-aspartate) O-methyltransferase [Tunicatimonas pelagia]|uniref:protein-L-isoaspartate(D-aspartate) O-methyltransferase n=1 Tax=Tunicatimonas pelagia TaxID=931531 RepID=UPI0026662E93|nr:protein-L-isoaspartate(D-aspartate) O-methyltransferase [Tunicatimonas pelagia]WKN43500.1 protein-L-isoaspartate(D-aspartate) O-methyltransferase [Tunicatimonas pelagia]
MSSFIEGYKHRGMRRALIQQLYHKGIRDERVLRAMEQIPRHAFMDSAFVNHAYQDKAFQIGEGQTISQPYTVAFQSELLQLEPGMKVLEIGTGSGYQCAVLSVMGGQVYSIEYNQILHSRAKELLNKLGYTAQLTCGDGTEGWALHAPYDRIVVTAGAPRVPTALIEQLATNGRLVIPVGDRNRQEMLLLEKGDDETIQRSAYELFSFVPLLGQDGWVQP